MICKPEPTKRAVIDVGRKCNVNCRFCYYHHLGDLAKQEFKSQEDISEEINAAINRGNSYLDFTGGEPTIFDGLPAIIGWTREVSGVKSCVITNGLAGENTTKKFLDAGVDDFLVSIHGMPETHDKLVGLEGARQQQIRFLDQLDKARMSFRVNMVLNRFNQHELKDVAKWILEYDVRIVNFINFNPHGEWAGDLGQVREVVPDLRELEDELNGAIWLLESRGIGVNVRYYPMCRISEEYRRCVCNDLQVMFDPYEWDYGVEPKTVEAYKAHGEEISRCIEWKGHPCQSCGIHDICGGINSAYNQATFGEAVDPQPESVAGYDAYSYRQYNYMTLQGRE